MLHDAYSLASKILRRYNKTCVSCDLPACITERTKHTTKLYIFVCTFSLWDLGKDQLQFRSSSLQTSQTATLQYIIFCAHELASNGQIMQKGAHSSTIQFYLLKLPSQESLVCTFLCWPLHSGSHIWQPVYIIWLRTTLPQCHIVCIISRQYNYITAFAWYYALSYRHTPAAVSHHWMLFVTQLLP